VLTMANSGVTSGALGAGGASGLSQLNMFFSEMNLVIY
jgi:hypothetical protein